MDLGLILQVRAIKGTLKLQTPPKGSGKLAGKIDDRRMKWKRKNPS